MSTSFPKRKLTVITIVYWFLLSYIIAALVWWYIALSNQNEVITKTKLSELQKDHPTYFIKAAQIFDESKRKRTQYIGEGITFFILIIVGAVFVYRSARKQIKLSQQQQNFMMAITHELKTPIAITNINLETLQKRTLNTEQKEKLITNTLFETNRLNNLCNNILFASQIDSGIYKTIKTEVNISELAESVVENIAERFPERKFNINIIEGVRILGEELLLSMLFNNLIENAIKYSPKNSMIKIELDKNSHNIFYKVSDEGIGILDSEKSKIFNKFYRIGNENTRRTKGTGLGLYLCSKIAETHKANISVTNNQPMGSIFTVIF